MTTLIAECATAHGGQIDVARDMIAAAADAGAQYVKFQAYTLARLNPNDPQADWLKAAALSEYHFAQLMAMCEVRGTGFLVTPFDEDALAMLRGLGVTRFKIASSEAERGWYDPQPGESWFISWPWGRTPGNRRQLRATNLTAIPLYPTPLECVAQAPLLDGWSDHTVGLDACLYQMARGARVIEAHLTIPGRSRQMVWDKTPEQFQQLARFAESVTTMQTGVCETFRTRWTA